MTTAETARCPDLGPLPFAPGRYFSDTVNKSELWIYLRPRRIQHIPLNTRPTGRKEHTRRHSFLVAQGGWQMNNYIFRRLTCDAIKWDVLTMWLQGSRHTRGLQIRRFPGARAGSLGPPQSGTRRAAGRRRLGDAPETPLRQRCPTSCPLAPAPQLTARSAASDPGIS